MIARLKKAALEVALLLFCLLIAAADLLLPRLITGIFDELGIIVCVGIILYAKIKGVFD